MKKLKVTMEYRAYSEDEAKNYLDKFLSEANEKGYIVGTNGYTYKTKKSKGEIISEGWLCKCTAIYNDFWGDEDQ